MCVDILYVWVGEKTKPKNQQHLNNKVIAEAEEWRTICTWDWTMDLKKAK